MSSAIDSVNNFNEVWTATWQNKQNLSHTHWWRTQWQAVAEGTKMPTRRDSTGPQQNLNAVSLPHTATVERSVLIVLWDPNATHEAWH